MKEDDKELSEQESLRLITSMIQKAKGGYHEKGTSAILWGSVVAFSGLVSFAEEKLHFYIGFDIWVLTFAAIIPQIIISVKESRERRAISRDESFMSAVWSTFGISVMALVFYNNVMPSASEHILKDAGVEWLEKDMQTGTIKHLTPYVVGQASLYLILYAIPTLVTGIARKFKPMLWGGILCYVLFVISCFTPAVYDLLLLAMAGIFNWLIPGLILRKRYLKMRSEHV